MTEAEERCIVEMGDPLDSEFFFGPHTPPTPGAQTFADLELRLVSYGVPEDHARTILIDAAKLGYRAASYDETIERALETYDPTEVEKIEEFEDEQFEARAERMRAQYATERSKVSDAT